MQYDMLYDGKRASKQVGALFFLPYSMYYTVFMFYFSLRKTKYIKKFFVFNKNV